MVVHCMSWSVLDCGEYASPLHSFVVRSRDASRREQDRSRRPAALSLVAQGLDRAARPPRRRASGARPLFLSRNGSPAATTQTPAENKFRDFLTFGVTFGRLAHQ